MCLNHLGEIAQLQDDLESAQGHYLQSFLLYKEIGFSPGMFNVLIHLVDILQKGENIKLALALLLKVNREYRKVELQDIQKNVTTLKERLSLSEFQEVNEMSLHKSFEEILDI